MRKTHHYLVTNSIFLIGLFLLSYCQTPDTSSNDKMERANIIYILADDLGYGDIGAFNPEGKISTPHLNQLATEGMMFTDAHTTSAVCSPTRYGILTGRYNWRSTLKSGVLWSVDKALIPNDRETVASLLQKSGYHTAFIGKWHLGWDWDMDKNNTIDFSKPVKNTPNDIGFDYAYGHIASLDIPPYVYVENGQSTAIPTDSTINDDYQGFWRKGLTAPDFIHDQVTPNFFNRSIQYIEERAQSGRPFFLYLALPSPHTPILPLEQWQGKSGLNPYADFMMMIDDYMGKLTAAIKNSGIEDNTMVIFTSDNGCSPRAQFDTLESKGHYPSYHFRGHKADIYEGGHRVPFIVKWPNQIAAGSKSNRIICTTDFFATCADITQQEYGDNAGEDSYSLLPLFLGNENFQRPATVHHSVNGSFAIRQGDWKLILGAGSCGWSFPRPNDPAIDTLPPFQLYNLKEDVGEQKNLIKEQADKAEALKKLLIQYIENGRSTPGTPQKNDGEYPWKQLHWM